MRLAMVRRERRDDCHGNHRRYADHHDQLPRLRKDESKNKVRIFIMNNVVSCLLVKTLYFGILSLVAEGDRLPEGMQETGGSGSARILMHVKYQI